MKRKLLFAALATLFQLHCFADDTLLHQVLLDGSRTSQLGLSDAANAGTVNKKKLDAMVTSSPGEILEAIPGVIVSQHSGEGKANQFYLRGFNLDHGTDLRTSLDEMPVNQRSHAHGQGWTDLNFLIPELTTKLDYKKGPYTASNGDFSAAGSAAITYAQRLSQSIASTSLGQHGYGRALLAGSPELGDASFLYALELMKNDGPFIHPDGLKKINAVLRYSQGYANNGYSLSAMHYKASWNASDQIPLRAVNSGQLNRFDTIDSSDGGQAQRSSLSTLWRRTTSDAASKVSAYLIQNQLKLFSNFSYFMDDPVNGDQFSQPDRRLTSGLNASHTWHTHWGGRATDIHIGAQLQSDNIFNGLEKTRSRQMLSTVRKDHIQEASLGLYLDASVRWNDYFRSNIGLRQDHYRFKVDSDSAENSGKSSAHLLSPSASLIFGPWSKTEIYFNAGNGFHSNDARATVGTRDPVSLQPTEKAAGLVRARGLEFGLRSELIPHLESTFSIYRLDFDSELNFVGDAGSTQAGRPSRRVGIEISNRYQASKSISINLDAAYTKARSRNRIGDQEYSGNYLVGAAERVAQLAVNFDKIGPWSGALRLRYVGPRALSEDNSVTSNANTSANARITYQINRNLKIDIEAHNLSNRQAAAAEYFYASQLKGENQPQQDRHFHPVAPRSFRIMLTKHY